MSKLFMASLCGALSILFLAGLARETNPMAGPVAALPLPAISADAVDARGPRECSAVVTTGCTYE